MKVEPVKKNKLKRTLNVLVSGIMIVVLFLVVKEIISSANSITKISESAGAFGPIVLVLLMSLGILFSPIPSVILIITAGYLYGVWLGALYSYIAQLLAAISVFTIVRKFKIKNKMKNKRFEQYKKLVGNNQNVLYLLFIIPIIPISITSIISASSKVSWKKFLEVTLIGFAPGVLFFSLFGNRISNKSLIEIGIMFVIVLGIIAEVYIKINAKNKK